MKVKLSNAQVKLNINTLLTKIQVNLLNNSKTSKINLKISVKKPLKVLQKMIKWRVKLTLFGKMVFAIIRNKCQMTNLSRFHLLLRLQLNIARNYVAMKSGALDSLSVHNKVFTAVYLQYKVARKHICLELITIECHRTKKVYRKDMI